MLSLVDVQYLYCTFSGRSVQPWAILCSVNTQTGDAMWTYPYDTIGIPVQSQSDNTVCALVCGKCKLTKAKMVLRTTHYILSFHTRFLVMVDTTRNIIYLQGHLVSPLKSNLAQVHRSENDDT